MKNNTTYGICWGNENGERLVQTGYFTNSLAKAKLVARLGPNIAKYLLGIKTDQFRSGRLTFAEIETLGDSVLVLPGIFL